MKKRVLRTLLSALLVSAYVGCGAESTTGEPSEATITIEESTPEITVEATVTTEESEAPTMEATTEVTEEVETTEEITDEETVEPETSEEPTVEPIPEPKAEYTYTDMSATMYATQTVNVRNLPSTDGEKIGSLSTNQEVAVKGQCNETGWYMFDYNGETAFVSNKYLSSEKVEVVPATTGTNSLASHFGVTLPFTATLFSRHGWDTFTFVWNSPTEFNADVNFICHLQIGVPVTISDLHGSPNDCMAYITMPDGTSGWVSFSYNGYNSFTW